MNPGGEGWAERLKALTEGCPRDLLPFPERDFQIALAASRAQAPAQWRRLEALAPKDQERRCERYRTYRSWGLAELLCRESIHQASRDPAQAVHLAYLASLIAMALFEDPPPWASHARAMLLALLTFAHLGNAHRVADDLPLAREVFDGIAEGRKALAGHPDPLGYLPRVLELEASLLRAQRHLPEALAALQEVIAHYRRRDPHRAARAMVKAAKTYEELNRVPQALDLLQRAAPLVDRERDPDLARALLHNRTYYLAAVGQVAEAQRQMPRLREAFDCDPGSLDAIRLDWLQAQIELANGERTRARRLLQRAWEAFTRAGLSLDAALVTLELACLAAGEGDSDEVRRLARNQLPVFEEQAVRPEALAALRLLRYAALEERVDRAYLEELRHWFRRARQSPSSWLKDLPLRDAWPPHNEACLRLRNRVRTRSKGRPDRSLPLLEPDFQIAVAASRARAAAQWRRLSALSPQAQERRCAGSGTFRSWGLAELLCQESLHIASREPAKAVHIAYLACLIAMSLRLDPPAWAPHAQVHLLALLSIAHLGNALRVADDPSLARRVFDSIAESREALAGHPDPLGFLPQALRLESSLLRVEGRLLESLNALEKLIAHHSGRDPQKAARAMANAAKTYEVIGRIPEALDLVERAIALVDHHRDSDLARALLHNQTYYLAAVGRVSEAQQQMPRLRDAFAVGPPSLDAIRMDWVQAEIEVGRGERGQARRLLLRAREAFLNAGLTRDADLVTVEIACLAAGAGSLAKVRCLAAKQSPTIEQRTLHREVLEQLHHLWCDQNNWSKADPQESQGYRPRILNLLANFRRTEQPLAQDTSVPNQVGSHCLGYPSRLAPTVALEACQLGEAHQSAETLAFDWADTSSVDCHSGPQLAETLLLNPNYFVASLRRSPNTTVPPRTRDAFTPEPGSLDAFRMDWSEARKAEGYGNRARARWLLEKVRNRFSRAGLAFDAALAALELACLAADDGDAPEVRRIARTLIPVFEGQQVHREALAALRLFHYGALEEQIDQSLVRSVYDYLRKARYHPDLKFPGAGSSPTTDT